MEQNQQFKDWIFRYQTIYRLRRTKKQKQRFISALVTDIIDMRKDIQVIEYKQNRKYVSSNVYVGNIETAEKIVCTYFDTPTRSFEKYDLFDRKKQRRSVINFILISSGLMLFGGLLLTLIYMGVSKNPFELTSPYTFIVILFYGSYFYLFSQVTKGLARRNNLIRNTSSVLALLTLIKQVNNKNIAFAFLDEGCVGELGLDVLKSACKASAKIYSLDSIGTDTDLHFIGEDINKDELKHFIFHSPQKNDQINHIFGARVCKSKQSYQYYLEKADLNKKTLKTENLLKVVEFFK